MAYDLSIIIAARNEFFHEVDLLHHTVENVLANTGNQTEIIVVLDGYDSGWPPQPLPSNPRLTVIQHSKSIGQRAACNEGARVSKAKFICKLDSHCAVDKDFDTKMMAHCDYLTTLIPIQYNLHAFSWKCKQCGHEEYQGAKPERCRKCKSKYLKQVVKWLPRGWKERDGEWSGNPKTTAWRFDSTLHFQYWPDLSKRFPSEQKLTPTMSCLGACWMLQRERYWEIEGMDEKSGSWGQMGTELSCKTWLSGGQMLTNHHTWFAHLFRTQPNFGFPYPNPGVERARARSREIWLNDKWPKAKYPLSWLIKKFAPVPDFPDIKPTKGIVYYTCGTLDEAIAEPVRRNLVKSKNGHELGVVSLQRADFGDWTIVLQRERSAITMHHQILAGLERSTADYVFLCEHDVLYHPSHFEFVPPKDNIYYYNTNVWRVRYEDGHAVRTDDCKQVSGLCANRKLLVEHYRKRVERMEREGFSRSNGYEPGTRHLPNGYDNHNAEGWSSPFPNLDIRHSKNLTKTHWTIDSFRNPKYAKGWQETDAEIPGWGQIAGRVQEFLDSL